MPLINVRELLEFPSGVNSSDTQISGVHFNLTALKQWNYTYYSNGTLSNGTNCVLTFSPYTPALLANGTFLNGTGCYVPIKSIGTRGIVGIVFSVYFALAIMFTFINLRKHGQLLFPAEKRFRAVGRRWQWYWIIVVAALGMASGISSVDIDRYYLPEFPLVLTSLTWFIMLPTTMAAVWESVRHWGSWQERQLVDPDPFALRQDDRRAKTEFYLPLLFYTFAFLNFFAVIPRAWTPIEEQRSVDQIAGVAEPAATDTRFKVAAFLLFLSWLVVCFSLRHSIHHYKPRNRGLFNSFVGFFRYAPIKFLLTIPLSLIMIGYEVAIAFDFSFSPLRLGANPAWIYGLGWTPIALIILIHEVAGIIYPNEDTELLRQRRMRGAEIDQEMGVTKKPRWWSRLHTNLNDHEAIAKNVREVGGGAATARNVERSIEMGILPTRRPTEHAENRSSEYKTPDAIRSESFPLFPTSPGMSGGSNSPADMRIIGDSNDRGRAGASGVASSTTERTGTSERSASTVSATTLNSPPQQIRSMLDV